MADQPCNSKWSLFSGTRKEVPRVGRPDSSYALKCPHCGELIITTLSRQHRPKVADDETLAKIKSKVGKVLGIKEYLSQKENET